MRINWKNRLQNKATLTALVAVLVAAIYQAAAVFGIEIPVEQEWVITFAGYIITALVLIGVIVDPTTEGINDSRLAMTYEKPRTGPVVAATPAPGNTEADPAGDWEIISELK